MTLFLTNPTKSLLYKSASLDPIKTERLRIVKQKPSMKYLMQGSSSTKSWKMLLHLFLFSFTVNAVSSQLTATTSANCTSYLRKPDHSDIAVTCGTNSISLAIQLCPAVYSGFNESQLFLNNIMDDPNCRGSVDNSVVPPVLRYTFAINMTSGCGSTLTTTSAPGTGIFADFSNIQTVNVSGVVKSFDTTLGVVTYNTDLKYYYSCSYPLEYLINNTRLDVSSSAIAVRDRNGSFISTLSLKLYSDVNYTTPLIIPAQGIELRSSVYVLVQATNLTSQYFVLLDRCYASVSPFPTNSTYFNLFVGCYRDQMTSMLENGQSQSARFSFPAFRFMEQQNQTISRYYLHCITRLCESSACIQFKSCANGRRRRDVQPVPSTPQDGLTDSTTLTSSLIITRADTGSSKEQVVSGSKPGSDTSLGLGVAVGILAVVCVGVFVAAFVFYKKLFASGGSKFFRS